MWYITIDYDIVDIKGHFVYNCRCHSAYSVHKYIIANYGINCIPKNPTADNADNTLSGLGHLIMTLSI